jgi:hypothetical protein
VTIAKFLQRFVALKSATFSENPFYKLHHNAPVGQESCDNDW